MSALQSKRSRATYMKTIWFFSLYTKETHLQENMMTIPELDH